MASQPVLDFDSLLAPVSDDHPSGVELKEHSSLSAVYYQIKDTRDSSRASERQLLNARLYGDEQEVARIDPPDWRKLKSLALDALATKSKDLWVAAWLIEALTRLDGFAGLRDGFRLTREIVERFWDDIHPRPDEDGYETTVAQLAGLNGEDAEGALIAPIESIPITQGTSYDPLTSRDYRQAVDLQSITDPERRAQRAGEAGAVTMELFNRAVAETSPEFFRNLRDDIDQCLDEFSRLGEALESRCGENEDGYSAAPPASQIRRTLEECRDRVSSLAQEILGDPSATDSAAGAETSAADAGSGAGAAGARPAASSGPVANRDEAFRTLLQVADFFRRTEPHSPVSYALEQAVRWGKMTLPELMAELISEEGTRDDLFRRVGILKRESSDDD
jgi:type VI secretion system protein ImpA